MSLYPILWALEHAPVVDAAERAVLMALANKGDFDGHNAYRGYPALARVAKVDTKTVRRKCHAMEERGILRRQTGKMPEGWLKLPADKKTVVWVIMIPASFWSTEQLERINESRAERGRDPITPENRPDLAPAPEKAGRKDKGQERPERRKKKTDDPEKRGDTKSPGTEGTTSPPATGHEVPSRGDTESPNPLTRPSDKTIRSSSSARVKDVTDVAATPAPKKKTKMMSKDQEREQAKTLIAQRLPDSTPEERDQIIDLVYAEAATQGRKIGFIASYIGGRPDSLLEQDLAQVRRYASAPPSGALCSEHDLSLASGKCASCEGDMNTGDFEVVRRILARDGAGARPDLARRLGTPQTESGGHVPYRNPADQSVYDEPLYVPTAPTDFSGDF